MPKIVNIQYNPALSVKENATKNHVSETSIRNYIQKQGLDRRHDRKQNIIAECKKYLKKHPNASRNELQRETGHSLSTIRQYWKYISTEETLIDFNKEKVKKYHIQQEESKEKQFAYLDTIPKEVILEYLAKRDEREQSKDNEKKRVEKVTILDGIPFNPFEEFHIPVADCIQFHSKALPEYKVLSNHYECIITFRGYEFYGLEQMYAALKYSDSPSIIKQIMACTSGKAAKSLCHKKYADKVDWDYQEKQYRMIALCHLYKYLSVKEYRDRLRETYPQTLVECPNGNDDEFGLVQNLETNIFEGNNCSGRTSMIVRDRMLALENEVLNKRKQELGRELSNEEQEAAFQELYDSIRNKFDNDKQVIKDSKPLFAVLEKEGISKVRDRHPKPITVPIIDRDTKCLVLDFDDTLFDTSADDEYRKGRKKDMDKAKSMIPQYHLYEGWQEVIDWTQNNGVEIAILSSASGDLIEKALNHFNIPCAAVIGFQPYIEKPNTILGNMLQERLHIRHEQIIYVGNSKSDEVQSRASQFRFIGTTWLNSDTGYFKEKGVQTVDNPKELIPIMEEAGWHLQKKKNDIIGLGTIAGDVIGKAYEAKSKSIKTTDFPLFSKTSKYTDDTVLTIAIMDWLLTDNELTWDKLADRFVHYGTRYRIKGKDCCFSREFKAWLYDENRSYGRVSSSNGAAMRVSPVGWFFDTVEEVENAAKIQASLTHNSEEAIQGAQVAAVSLLLARQGKSKDEIKSFIEGRYGWNLNIDIDEYRKDYEWTVFCMKSVESALVSFLNSTDYETCVRNAVSLGGDADTIGAIAGSIAEAFYGGVPNDIKRVVLPKIEKAPEFVDVLKRFSDAINNKLLVK